MDGIVGGDVITSRGGFDGETFDFFKDIFNKNNPIKTLTNSDITITIESFIFQCIL
jgi:hypothetical protein